jgi:hypothetical protein
VVRAERDAGQTQKRIRRLLLKKTWNLKNCDWRQYIELKYTQKNTLSVMTLSTIYIICSMSKTGNQSDPSINNDHIKFAIIFAKNKPSFVFTKNRMVILSAGVPYL